MSKTFRSKIGIIMLVAIVGSLLMPFFLMPVSWVTFFMIAVIAPFTIPPLLGTYYKIEGDVLRIKCAFMFSSEVSIPTIVSIKRTRNPISSPALSLDRLEINYQNGADKVIVSPKDKRGFISTLKAINSRIAVHGLDSSNSTIL